MANKKKRRNLSKKQKKKSQPKSFHKYCKHETGKVLEVQFQQPYILLHRRTNRVLFVDTLHQTVSLKVTQFVKPTTDEIHWIFSKDYHLEPSKHPEQVLAIQQRAQVQLEERENSTDEKQLLLAGTRMWNVIFQREADKSAKFISCMHNSKLVLDVSAHDESKPALRLQRNDDSQVWLLLRPCDVLSKG